MKIVSRQREEDTAPPLFFMGIPGRADNMKFLLYRHEETAWIMGLGRNFKIIR